MLGGELCRRSANRVLYKVPIRLTHRARSAPEKNWKIETVRNSDTNEVLSTKQIVT